jgi:putative N6-adenine-specific DNA methylase
LASVKQDDRQDNIAVETHNFFKLDIELHENTLLVLNPPYGERLKNSDTRSFYGKLGNLLNKKYNNCGIAIIVPDKECEKALSLKYDRKISFTNGGLRVSVLFRDV